MLKRFKQEQGFTLIEILIAVVIIGILASLIGPSLFNNVSDAKQEAARNQLDVFKLALDDYRLDTGDYPTTQQGLEALTEKPTTPPVPENWSGPYLDHHQVPLDPWGNKYHYQYPPQHRQYKYDLYSYGKDNKEGGSGEDADVTNW